MKNLSFTFFFFVFTFSFCAQKTETNKTTVSPDEEAIRQTIGNYFEGWMTADTTLLGSAMHATCQLKNIKENKVVVYDRAAYLGFFKPSPRKVDSGGRIISIDITGPIAAAKVEIETPNRLFTDYFNMMKLADRWYIVDKISTSVAKE